MTVKEYAGKMGVSVDSLCRITGLSRQGLHDIIVKRYIAKDSKKRHEAADNIRDAARKAWEHRLVEAEAEYTERLKLSYMLEEQETEYSCDSKYESVLGLNVKCRKSDEFARLIDSL